MPDGGNDGSALRGIRVLDLSTYLAGPFSTALLGEFGAEVIKVELPEMGDTLRTMGPSHQGVGLWWIEENRNKLCITLDLRKPKGQEIARRLIATSDVVYENFRQGTLEGWGLGFEELQKVNPGIILTRISGFGQTGPYSQTAGFGKVA